MFNNKSNTYKIICGQDNHILKKQQLTKMERKKMKWKLNVLTKVALSQGRF